MKYHTLFYATTDVKNAQQKLVEIRTESSSTTVQLNALFL